MGAIMTPEEKVILAFILLCILFCLVIVLMQLGIATS